MNKNDCEAAESIADSFLRMACVNCKLEENEESVNLLVAFICLFSYISYVN